MDEPDYAHELVFESEHLMPDQINGSRALKKLEIYPNAGRAWDFTLLATFLNELGDFKKPSRRGFTLDNENGRPNGKFVFSHKNIPKYFIVVFITDLIKVVASTPWLTDKWTRESIVEFSSLRKGGKTRSHPITEVLEFFSFSFPNPTAGSKCLYCHGPLIYCSYLDFSNIFHFFAKKIDKIGIPSIYDTASIKEYIELFCVATKMPVSSLDALKSLIHGYIQFDIQQISSKRRLASINHDGKRYYIKGGIYISPFAKAIITSGDCIKGLLLDTTWKIMPMYVTSIIMASSMNVGIPLGFSFGSGEDKTLYQRHFAAFSEQLGVDISKFVTESDQESVCLQFVTKNLQNILHVIDTFL